MMVQLDVTLLKSVHIENYGQFNIMMMLTRFGGLSVMAHNDDWTKTWQGDNVIDARNWCKRQEG